MNFLKIVRFAHSLTSFNPGSQLHKRVETLEKEVKNISILFNNLENNIISSIDKKIEMKFNYLEKKIDANKNELELKFEKKFKNIEKKIDRNYDSVNFQLSKMRLGLGQSFEKFNASWVKHLLKSKGLKNKVQIGYICTDLQRTVHPENTETEIDVYSVMDESNILIGEATTFVDKTEYSKIEAFVRKGNLVSKKENCNVHLYFFTFAIHSSIDKKFRDFCNENKITLLGPMPFEES